MNIPVVLLFVLVLAVFYLLSTIFTVLMEFEKKKLYKVAPTKKMIAKIIEKDTTSYNGFEDYGYIKVRTKDSHDEYTFRVNKLMYYELTFGIYYDMETKLNKLLSAKEEALNS